MTDPACKTLQEVRDDLRDHVEQAHDSVVQQEVSQLKAKAKLAIAQAREKEAEAKKIAAKRGTVTEGSHPRGERRTPLVRPKIEEDCTESDWSFFTSSWERYEKACGLGEEEANTHLWSACFESL